MQAKLAMQHKCFIFLLIFNLYTFAQEERKDVFRYGISIDQHSRIYRSIHDYNYPLSVLAILYSDKHQIEFGPSYYLLHRQPGYKFGLQSDYKFYPNGHARGINSFLLTGLSFRFGKDYNDPNYPSYWTNDLKSNQIYGGLHVGYGIEWNLKNSLFIGSDVRLLSGYGFHFYQAETDLPPQMHRSGHLYIDFQLGLNFGFRF